MKKISFILLCVNSFLFSSTINEMYEEAKSLELNGKYKEAMYLYKEIAQKESSKNRIYVDESNQKAIFETKKRLNTIEDKETVETIEQIVSSNFNIYPYKENYFLPISYDTKERSDREQAEAKFQLSVKKPIIHNFFGLNETFYFGYTHTSWWQIYAESSPFRETNYKPEFFVTVPYGENDKTALKGYKIGFLHESNGQSEPESRSWNRVYLEGYFQAGNLFAIPRVWYRLKEDENKDDNPDILDYLGYGDITLTYPYKKHTFKLLLRNNLKFNDENKGFAELNWSFPFFGSKNTFGYLQLSSGYGDSLIDYDKEINRIGFGISLSR